MERSVLLFVDAGQAAPAGGLLDFPAQCLVTLPCDLFRVEVESILSKNDKKEFYKMRNDGVCETFNLF